MKRSGKVEAYLPQAGMKQSMSINRVFEVLVFSKVVQILWQDPETMAYVQIEIDRPLIID